MSRKQKKKDAREQSTRQLMGIDDITDYGIATRMGELVFFIIKPTNISVLPDAGVGARIYALLNVVKGMAEIEMLALNSKESFENNKAFYRQRANEEELPVIRKLLEAGGRNELRHGEQPTALHAHCVVDPFIIALNSGSDDTEIADDPGIFIPLQLIVQLQLRRLMLIFKNAQRNADQIGNF